MASVLSHPRVSIVIQQTAFTIHDFRPRTMVSMSMRIRGGMRFVDSTKSRLFFFRANFRAEPVLPNGQKQKWSGSTKFPRGFRKPIFFRRFSGPLEACCQTLQRTVRALHDPDAETQRRRTRSTRPRRAATTRRQSRRAARRKAAANRSHTSMGCSAYAQAF